jgi:ABC transporter fused permease/ATP-binding protein
MAVMWTGILDATLTCSEPYKTEATPPLKPTSPSSSTSRLDFKRIRALAYPEVKRLTLGTIALFIGVGIGLSVPKLVGQLIDGLSKGSGPTINQSTLLLLVLFAISGVATALRSYWFTAAGEHIVARLRTDLYTAVIRREIAFFDLRRTGELLNRLSSDTTVLQNTVTVNLSMALRNSLQILGTLVILMMTSWQLTLVMLAIVPLVALGTGFYGRSLRKVSLQVQDALAASSEVAEESLSAIRTVRIFAGENKEIARYGNAVEESYQQALYRARLVSVFSGGVSFAGYAAIAAVLWYGGRLLQAGTLSFGELTSFILYTFTMAIAIATMSSLWADFAKAAGASERVFELLDDAPVSSSGERELPTIVGRILLENVSFSYPSRPETPVLKNLSMALSPGKIVALVGPSGGGKSTVAALLSRLYEPDSGLISLDDVPYTELSAHWLRQHIGVVNQEPTLFAASIADNIRYARPEASQQDIEDAARAANAHDFIMRFPEGYDALVGERGVRLSGGQKQRIAIARALLSNPVILLLDEATSALDAESEHLVQEALERLMQGRTSLVIAHRLSTVKQADRVIVLAQGEAIESGTHEELVAQDGLYKRLVERQFKD